MKKLTDKWFIDNPKFYKDGDYFKMSCLDINYCFKYADFRDNWGFYVEYTDSPDSKDDGVGYPVSFGIETIENIEALISTLNII